MLYPHQSDSWALDDAFHSISHSAVSLAKPRSVIHSSHAVLDDWFLVTLVLGHGTVRQSLEELASIGVDAKAIQDQVHRLAIGGLVWRHTFVATVTAVPAMPNTFAALEHRSKLAVSVSRREIPYLVHVYSCSEHIPIPSSSSSSFNRSTEKKGRGRRRTIPGACDPRLPGGSERQPPSSTS
jgi:hypothetical protein